MKSVCTRLGGDQHGRTSPLTVFCGVGVCQYFKFLDVVDVRKNSDPARIQLVIVVAVEKPIGIPVRENLPQTVNNEPRVAASLLAASLKKLTGLVDAVVPGVSVASCTKLRPFKREFGNLLRR